MNRRAIVASLAALPFVRPTAAATIPDIHQLQPDVIYATERYGALTAATVGFRDQAPIDALYGKTFGFYGTPLVCTKAAGGPGVPTYFYFEEINL